MLLGFIPCIAATHCTGNSGYFLTAATAHLITQQTAHYSTSYTAHNAVLVFNRLTLSDGHITTLLARRSYGFLYLLNRDHLCITGATDQTVGGISTTCCDSNRTQHATNQHRLIHFNSLRQV